MFIIAVIGGTVAYSPFTLTTLLDFIKNTDAALYSQILMELANAGLTLQMLYNTLFAIGGIMAIVGLIGMLVALGTAYKKSWAVPLGISVSIMCILGSVTSYIIQIYFPQLLSTSLANLVLIGLNVFFGVLAINILFVGAFFLWQIDELHGIHKTLGRYVLIWNLDAISLFWTAALLPGIMFATQDILTVLGIAYLTVAIISLLNLLIRPVFTRFVAQAARWWLGFGLSFILIILVNAGILFIIPLFLPELVIAGIPSAILGSIVLSAVNSFFVSLIGLDDDSSFFNQFVAEQLVAKAEKAGIPQTTGLVAIEIDGLSHDALQAALTRGVMPVLKSLIDRGDYQITKWDCGLPSMTSSCQAGIMYGNNEDIPAFRWYVKPEGKMVVSNHPADAHFIDRRAATGNGILRNGGSSVSNLISGDAAYSFFTMSTLTDQDQEAGRRRSEDLYYYLLNPYALNRSIIFTIWDVLVELGQILKQTLIRRKPRMNRLAHGYPFVRAVTNIFMRDVATAMVCQDIFRGTPAIYVTYLGYDEIAHHSGPFTSDALKALRGLDKQIRRIRKVIEEHAPRPYHLFILADHGQSAGWTFKQLYGTSLKETIADLLEGKAQVGEVEAIDAHRGYVAGLVKDLTEGQDKARKKGVVDRTISRSRKFLERRLSWVSDEKPKEPIKPDDVILCASGNLAQVYFTYKNDRVTLQELEDKFPGFISKLVAHEGVGFVIVMDENKGPVLLSKEGGVTLRTGEVQGTNPLASYGRFEIRVKQLLRLAEYPSSGALIIISPIFPDGSIPAYEELIGHHGGLGGLQTEPFLVHPKTIKVDGDSIINSDQIYSVLNQGRES